MHSTNVKAAADFLSDLEALEADHGIYLKADRMVTMIGTGDRPRSMGSLALNGTRTHQWFVV